MLPSPHATVANTFIVTDSSFATVALLVGAIAFGGIIVLSTRLNEVRQKAEQANDEVRPARITEAKQRATAFEARDLADRARAAAEAEATNASRHRHVANLSSLQAALDGPRRSLTGEFFSEEAAACREGYGDSTGEPIVDAG
jgi:hypothetical protein